MLNVARFCARTTVLVTAFALSCCTHEPTLDFPPVIAESNETAVADNAGLAERCLSFAKAMASGLQAEVGSPHLTHSQKWGDISRVDLTGSDSLVTRIACTTDKNVVGVLPSSQEKLVPPQMQGVWAIDSQCRMHSPSLTITATSVQFGAGRSYEVRYFVDRDAPDRGTIVTTNATWTNPQYDPSRDVMVWRDKKGETTYRRCQR